ncbi:MAG: selenocysteine-specific translation elongation factor [bacterium]|nr:selenocysteine-specific translation elongation factor [bacterium]
MAQDRHFILGAAGHVDHGKTALITALTGTHTDRLKEERERGISIELGFAEFELSDGLKLGVVDMPGHEKFVKQMVSGAGGVDLAFLVVAADEGVMPQTVEHLEILDSLAVASGVVVMTKTDLVDEDILAVATEEALELVEGTFLEGKPVVPVSAHTGAGLDDLKAALEGEALALPQRKEEGFFRMPVDRIFTLPGAGVVVTGTCWSGSVKPGDKLVVQPTGDKIRVREVQVHGVKADQGASGQRLALALHGVKKDEMERGFQIVEAKAVEPTRRLDIRVNVMSHYKGIIKNRQRVHVHHAGREVLGRIVLLDEHELGGDGGPRKGLAQMHLESDLIAVRDDRLVLRFYSPVVSIAGGVVLDANPVPHKRFDEKVSEILLIMEEGDTGDLFRQNLKDAGLKGLPVAEAMGHQDDPEAMVVGKRIYLRELLAELGQKIVTMVSEYGTRFPLRLGIPKEEARRKMKFKSGAAEWNAICRALGQEDSWQVLDDRIVLSEAGPPLNTAMEVAVQKVIGELLAFALDWPGLDNWAEESPTFREAASQPELKEFKTPEVSRYLVDHKYAVAINNDYLVSHQAFEELLQKLRAHFSAEGELAFAVFREISGLTRKLGIPMLEYLDQMDYTVRQGDTRRAGTALEEK